MRLVALLAVTLVCAVGGCDSGSVALHVQLSTDFVPGRDMGHVSLELDGPGGRRVELATPTGWSGADTPYPTLASFDGLSPGVHRVTAIARAVAPVGMRSDDGPIIGRRLIVLTLRNTLVVRVELSASCVGVTCPDEDPTRTECLAGRCVDPRCDREHAPELCCVGAACEGIFCETAELCLQPGGDCAEAACAEGLCVRRASPDRCGAGLYCNLAADSCLPLPGGEGADAGLLGEVDAFDGPPDAHVEPPDTGVPPADAFEDPPDAAVEVPDASGPCPLGAGCDDGNECTTGDVCTPAGCAGTAAPATTRCRAEMRSSCRDDRCDGAGRCVFTPINEDTSCDTDRNPCTANECRNGMCRLLNVPNGTACPDGDMNLCTVGACSAGECIGLPLPNGTRCTSTAGYICCGAACVNSRSSEDHCGACNVDCGTRSCDQGLCGCSTDAQCVTSLGDSRATCWDSTIAGDPAGTHCQCQCATGSTCDSGCPNLAHCREVSGYNECFYP